MGKKMRLYQEYSDDSTSPLSNKTMSPGSFPGS